MIEPEFIDDESLPLIQNYDQDIDDSVYEDTQETSFNDADDDEIPDTRNRLKADMIESLHKYMGWEIDENMIKLHLDRYKIEQENGQTILSFEKGGKWFNLTSKLTGGFRERNSIEKIITNTHLKNLGISILDMTPTEIEMNELTPQRLEEVIDEVTRSIGTNTDLDMREFLGIDNALTRISGELANNVSKLTEIDEHLKREHTKLDEIKDDPSYSENLRDRIKKRITDLKEERATRLEIATQNRKELASQFSRIRQTVEKILDEDLSLREKLKLVFREHGLTITAVLTSIGLIISTIVTALTGGSAGGSSTPPKKPSKLKEWIKSKLKALARVLGRLAGKAAAALPGIIGSIIAGVLNFLKKVVTAAAEHVWLFLLSIATLIGYKLVDSFQKPNRKKR